MSEASPPRRWFQFSLRAVLLVVTALAVAIALLMVAAREFRRSLWGDANFVTLENQSGRTLDYGDVKVAGQSVLWAAGLPPSKRHLGHCGTGPIVVTGKLSDGTLLHAEFAGIPAGAANQSYRIVIRPDGQLRFEP